MTTLLCVLTEKYTYLNLKMYSLANDTADKMKILE